MSRSFPYEFSGFTLDADERVLLRDGARVALPEKPFNVLRVLVERSGRLVGKEELMSLVWGNTAVEENNLDKSISRLRQTLGEGKGSDSCIETVRGHGYRFVARVTQSGSDRSSTTSQNGQVVQAVAVLPFRNLDLTDKDRYLGDGLAEEILNSLSRSKFLRVAARTSAFSFADKDVTASQIGKALGVSSLLEGSVRRSGGKFRVLARLVNAEDGLTIWSQSYDRKIEDIFDVEDDIALGVFAALDIDLVTDERSNVLKRHTADPEAYIQYLKGQYYRWKTNGQEFAKGLRHFEEAVRLDPKFALGYFGISTYYGYGAAWGMLGIEPATAWKLAEASAARAIELDPALPELRLSLAAFSLVNYRKWAEAGEEMASIAEANPRFPEIHHLYSFYLLTLGRFDEAIDEARKALDLDPLSMLFSHFLGLTLYIAGRDSEAIKQLLESAEIDPADSSAHKVLSEIYLKNGQFNDALNSMRSVAWLTHDDEAVTYLKSIEPVPSDVLDAARWLGKRQLETLLELQKVQYVPKIFLARLNLILGEVDVAMEQLEASLEEHNVFPLMLNVDPFYEPLRSLSDFQKLIAATGNPSWVS
ncbi:MAG: winged helix-turn-helix domain-containing protein [bacterium]|nr:winged helix-turn-helix domain-containing protein [bacterium]